MFPGSAEPFAPIKVPCEFGADPSHGPPGVGTRSADALLRLGVSTVMGASVLPPTNGRFAGRRQPTEQHTYRRHLEELEPRRVELSSDRTQEDRKTGSPLCGAFLTGETGFEAATARPAVR